MALRSIRILDFRNYKEMTAGPFGAVNILVGRNGSGKTNFLESVYLLSDLDSFRGVGLSDLVRWKQDHFYVSGVFDEDTVEAGYSAEKKVVKMNGRPAVLKEIKRTNPVVVFLPEDIRFITGGPDEKRDYIDHCLSLLDEDYRESVQRYQKTLKQRNAHLKASYREASVWDRELVRHGSRMIEKRLQFIQSANRHVSEIYQELYGDKPEIKYFNTFKIEHSIERSFRLALTESAAVERQKKVTVIGPHRDNYEVQIPEAGKRTARAFASQGQRRCMAIALNLYVADQMRKKMKKSPILLIDDILLELDTERRAGILKKFMGFSQVFFTATDLELFKGIPDGSPVFEIKDGSMNRRTADEAVQG